MPHKTHSRRSLYHVSMLFGGLIATAGSAPAAIIPLGRGWEAVVPDGDPATSVTVTTESPLYLNLELTFATLDPSEILFRQVQPDSATTSVIRLEQVIHNATGIPWTGYHFDLVSDGAAALFDGIVPTFAPFTTAEFVDNFGVSNTGVHFSGGVLAPGENTAFLYPGDGRSGPGYPLAIDLASEDPVEFTLRQMPIPEPAVIGLALGATMLVVGRRWLLTR